MAGTLRHAHGRFAQYWNTARGGVGHMWQNRYYSCALEAARVWAVPRYVVFPHKAWRRAELGTR